MKSGCHKRAFFGVVATIAMATALVPTPSQAEWVEWLANVEVERGANSNINNGVYSYYEHADSYTIGRVSLGRIYQLDNFSRLGVTFDAETAAHEEYDKLGYTTLGGSVVYRRKLGLGRDVPRLAVRASGRSIDSKSEIRSGWAGEAGLAISQRLHEQVDVSFGYQYDYRKGPDLAPMNDGAVAEENPNVYDLSGHGAVVRVDTQLTQDALLSFQYGFRRGSVAATCKPAVLKIIHKVVDARKDDDAIPGCAYRMEADTNTYGADLSYALLDGHASVNVGYKKVASGAARYFYFNDIWSASFVYSY